MGAGNFLKLLIFYFLQNILNANLVIKRQSSFYYVCGIYPNQYYSLTPCPQSSNVNPIGTCANGWQMLGVGCYNNYQCTPYAANAQCISGCCCVPPNFATSTLNPFSTTTTTNSALAGLAFCYNGQRTQNRCLRSTDCDFGQTCIQGVCCTTTGNEWAFACAGEAALAACRTGSCSGFMCTTSNYCCECQFGQTSGPCNNRQCGTGFTCSSSQYCCPSCANGAAPFGACFNNQCPTGYRCISGNICCPN